MTGSPLSSLPPPAFGDPIGIEAAPEVLTFLARRRSASALKLAAPGPDAAQVQDLLRLACRVPDHGKLAPWRFILLEGPDKAAFADRLDALARARGDERAAGKLGKLRTPPMGIAVISAPREADIPEWEQVLSAGAVCLTPGLPSPAQGLGRDGMARQRHSAVSGRGSAWAPGCSMDLRTSLRETLLTQPPVTQVVGGISPRSTQRGVRTTSLLPQPGLALP